MILNHQHRFIFFHVPKVAGSSIRAALLSLPGSMDIRQGRKHQTPVQFEGQSIFNLRYRLYFRFCFVRDPWERFGSFHRFLTRRDLKDFAAPADVNDLAVALDQRDPWLMDRWSIQPQSNYARGMKFVGRYERLHEDFAVIAKQLRLPDLALGHRNASGETCSYRPRMNARTEAIIADFYREDIERFGYR